MMCMQTVAGGADVAPTRRFADRRYADNVGRFADTYSCIKTAFHDTDILADILASHVHFKSSVLKPS